VFAAVLSQSAAGGEFLSGYIPVDQTQYLSFPKVPRYRGFVPEQIDLSNHFPRPGYQGKLASCTGWAVGYAARSYYAHTVENRKLNNPKDTPSPLYIFNAIRPPDDCTSGAYLPDALQLLLTKGSLSAADYPTEGCRRLTKLEKEKATDFKIKNWFRFDFVPDDLKSQLAKGDPIILGLRVDESFDSMKGPQVYAAQQLQPYPHAMTIVGYDERKQAFKIINSWGTDWGEKGFGWISYEAFVRDAIEAYIMQVKPPATPSFNEEVAVAPIPFPVPKPPKGESIQPEPSPEMVRPKPPEDLKSCSRIKIRKEGEETHISGFVGSPEELETIRNIYKGSRFKIDVQLRPWPQCEVLMTLEESLSATNRPVIVSANSQTVFKAGNTIVFEVKTPSQPSFIYISYVQADGTVVNLEQPSFPTSAPLISSKQYKFGDGIEGRARFSASPPFGQEMIVVLAALSPLFTKPLPKKQTEREYLSALRKAILYKTEPQLPQRAISAAFLGVETREK
jgi:hypothetical protein